MNREPKRRFLSSRQIAEIKRSEASTNARQRRNGTKHPTVAIAWGCGCCQFYSILYGRTIADTTVQEEERRRKVLCK